MVNGDEDIMQGLASDDNMVVRPLLIHQQLFMA